MSWSGTVYCRYCGNKGHNSRSCPDKTEHIRERAKREIEHGEGYEGYWGQQWLKRPPARGKEGVYADGTRIPAEKKGSTKQKRVCKYCGKRGHNRRTCPQLKADKQATLRETAAIRARVVAGLKEVGLGIGSIVTKEEYGENVGYMVVGFHLDTLTSESVRHNPRFLQTRVLRTQSVNSWNREPALCLPHLPGVPELEDSWGSGQVAIAGPVSGASVAAGIPASWIEDGAFVDALYQERQHPDYHENSWNS